MRFEIQIYRYTPGLCQKAETNDQDRSDGVLEHMVVPKQKKK